MKLIKASGIFLIMAAFLFYEMGVQVSPGVITHHLMRDLQVSALGLSWISGAYFITYTLMQIPAGLIYDRIHVRYAVIFPILLCAAGAYALSFAWDLPSALFARMLMGLGSAFAFIAVLVVVNDLFPAKYFALMAGVTQLLAAMGALCGEVPTVWSVNAIGWRNTMSALGFSGLFLALLVFIFVRYPKQNLQSKMSWDKIYLSLKTILKNTQTWYLALYACLLWAPMATFASLWGVPFIKTNMHILQTEAAFTVSLMWVGIAVGSPLLGWFSEKALCRKVPLILVALLGVVSMSLVVFAADIMTINMVQVCLFLAGAACSGQVLSFAVVKENNVYQNHAAAIGFNNMGVVLAGFLFQPLTGKLIENHRTSLFLHYNAHDYRAGLAVIPMCYLLGALIAIFFIRETYCRSTRTQ